MKVERTMATETIKEQCEKIKQSLSDQMGQRAHGIIVTVLLENNEDPLNTRIYPATVGSWAKIAENPKVICEWVASFADYLYNRLPD